MTFTVKIALQPFEVSFEAGSIGEAVAILQEPGNELSKLAALATGGTSEEPEETETTTAAAAPVKKERKKRGAVEAIAPPPIPVPDAAPPAPPAPVDTGIPAFLDRTGAAPVAIAPPPPMVAPPAAPPVGVLAPKVAAELKRRGDGAADQGAGLVDWLAKAGLCVPGRATFQEAVDCVSFLSDEKLGPVATALGVA